jgi:diguanylate cyclase (GGDEF)-like protein
VSIEKNRRILVIDDNRAIHDDFRKILAARPASSTLDHLEASLFGAPSPRTEDSYEIDSAYQGREGLAKVVTNLAYGQRYALAFVDMRMPPGWDGFETIERIWAVDPEIQVVICTAYSDHGREDLVARFGAVDRLLILKKPFDVAEVCQLACALTEKWHLARQANLKLSQLSRMVEEQTRELRRANAVLQEEIAVRQRLEDQLRHLASHDALTGLANRSLLIDRIGRCLVRTKRHPGYLFAVLFLDIDRFKYVNDSLGHLLGDQLLVAIARRLTAHLRATDTVAVVPHESTLARIGGDEFVVLLDGIGAPADAIRVAERLERGVAQPFDLEGHEVFSSTSIGICVATSSYGTPEEILRDADTALYQAKAAGKARYSVFDANRHAATMARWRLENDLRHAVEHGGLTVQYQPILSMPTGEIVELEALVRWRHPELGPISPADFIPLAEETGLIVPLGVWVMRRVCEQLHEWRQRLPRFRHLAVTINVSGKQFDEAGVVDDTQRILDETGIPANRIKLEITETALMGKTAETSSTLSRLSALGIELYLDDFGTGYSSLSYLRRMPIAALKIDQSFVSTMGADPMSGSIVQAIVTLAHTMGMKVVAEGVETEAQLEHLRQLQCDCAQGFYFHRPLDPAHVVTVVSPRPGDALTIEG